MFLYLNFFCFSKLPESYELFDPIIDVEKTKK